MRTVLSLRSTHTRVKWLIVNMLQYNRNVTHPHVIDIQALQRLTDPSVLEIRLRKLRFDSILR
jgi:predicted double-glycine peptidase